MVGWMAGCTTLKQFVQMNCSHLCLFNSRTLIGYLLFSGWSYVAQVDVYVALKSPIDWSINQKHHCWKDLVSLLMSSPRDGPGHLDLAERSTEHLGSKIAEPKTSGWLRNQGPLDWSRNTEHFNPPPNTACPSSTNTACPWELQGFLPNSCDLLDPLALNSSHFEIIALKPHNNKLLINTF